MNHGRTVRYGRYIVQVSATYPLMHLHAVGLRLRGEAQLLSWFCDNIGAGMPCYLVYVVVGTTRWMYSAIVQLTELYSCTQAVRQRR